MDNTTKVILSVGELAMAADKNIILTKRVIIEKTTALFTNQIPIITNIFLGVLKNDKILAASQPKIAKGENYKGLPYIIMDYPATFKRENIFAVRTMFWWGNFISITLHLKGIYKEKYFENILQSLGGDDAIYIATSHEEWEHDFKPGNFEKAGTLMPALNDKIKQQNFIKIALKYQLHQWNMMQLILPDGYKKIAAIIRG